MGISIALKSNLFDSFKYLIATGNNLKEKTLCRCNDLKRLPDSIGNEKEGIWQVSFWYSILHRTLLAQVQNLQYLQSLKICRGLWQHSFCGKVEEGESVVEAAVRELEEESGLQVIDHKMQLTPFSTI